jgi:hypothetical protein
MTESTLTKNRSGIPRPVHSHTQARGFAMNAEKLNAEQFEAYKAKGELGRLPRSADVPSDAIALKVSGDCLSPRVRDGQLVIVEPRLPVSGDIAAIWLKGEPMPAIKILRTEILGFPHNPKSDCITSINVEQLNPPERFTFWADRVECIARVHSVVRKSFADARAFTTGRRPGCGCT